MAYDQEEEEEEDIRSGSMAYDDFNLSGPTHLVGTTIDWNNAHHRRCIMASLVKGVYALKNDRTTKRKLILAPPWWNSFRFELSKELHDRCDGSVFGAIFEFKSPQRKCADISTGRYYINPPRYVIAFRGTSLKPNSMLEDVKLDIQYGLGFLHGSDRIKVAKKAVLDTINRKAGVDSERSVWLAGHSLGAAIALMVGRELIVEHNGPLGPLLKGVARFFRSQITGAVAASVESCRADESDFTLLSKWIPFIFVHPQDHISSEYIGYFEQRETMDRIGLGIIERLATQNSLTSILPNAKPAHLLPSAYLTTNLSRVKQFRQAHALEQWWASKFYWESKLYDKFWPVNFEELENGD